MTLFDSPAFEGHEGVHSFYDEKSGLKCIIAVHSTARGPAAGGCRMWPYASAELAFEDALRLSRAMSYKNAMADLELGGGKAVIIGDSRTQKTPALFEAFGQTATIRHEPPASGDIAHSAMSPQAIAQALDYTPATSLVAGLRALADTLRVA